MDLQKLLESKATESDFHQVLATIRWVDNAICPYCNGTESYKRSRSHGYKCRDCNSSFTATTGTLFHATKVPLRKWFTAIHLITKAAKGISSLQLARTIGVNKNTAWYMQYRIREGMKGKELFRLRRELFPSGKVVINKSRRHRDRLRPASSTNESPNRRKEKRLVTSPGFANNKLLLNRAIKGQYHQLSEFHVRNYDHQITFVSFYYKPLLVRSLLTGMCVVM